MDSEGEEITIVKDEKMASPRPHSSKNLLNLDDIEDKDFDKMSRLSHQSKLEERINNLEKQLDT